MRLNKISTFFIITITLFTSFSIRKLELTWEKNLPLIGSQSSPRVAELNQEGILDLIIGAVKNEFKYTEHGILTSDVSNGEFI